MPDDSDPIAPPLDAPTLNANDSRPDPGVIIGQARDLGSTTIEPPGAEASPGGESGSGPEDALPHARRSALPIWFIASALVGGVLGFGATRLLSPPPDLAKLNAQIDALGSAQATTAANVDGFSKRLASLEAAGAGAAKAPALQALEKRVGAMEPSIGELAKAVKAATAAAPVANGEAQPAPDLAPLNVRLDALDAGLKDLAGKADSAPQLAARVGALEAALGQAKSETQASTEVAVSRDRGAALAVMEQALAQKFAAGAPFVVELEMLKQLGASADALGVLAPLAPHGAPSLQKLAAAFDEAAPALISAEPAPDQGFTDRMMSELSSLVRVHAKGVVEGDSPQAIASQVRDALAKGDLAGALAAFQKFPEKARAAGEAWRASAEARASGQSALLKLQAEAYAALKPAAP